MKNVNFHSTENPYIEIIKKAKVIVIYGAGAVGHEVYDYLCRQGIEPDYFCSGINGGYIDSATGKEVLRKEELKDYANAFVILAIGDTASEQEKEEICSSLCGMGISRDRIFRKAWFENKVSLVKARENFSQLQKVYDLLEDDESKEVYKKRIHYMTEYVAVDFKSEETMYLDKNILNFGKNEVIIDAGAWIGDTATLFLNEIGQGCRVYSFEPDEKNYRRLVENMSGNSFVITENLGLWDSESELFFSDENNGSSHIENIQNKQNGARIRTTSLDIYCDKMKIVPTYIKMDIEGAEYNALLGAKDLIKAYRPKLAICIYHKFEDFFTLPLLIKELNPDYKLYVRHYSDNRTDTVVYAV